MNRKLKIILTVSIILNLLLLGILGGFAYKASRYMPRLDPDLRAQMSPEGRHLMARTFAESRREMGDTFRAAGNARTELQQILEAETFDPDAYQAASAELQRLQIRIMEERARRAGELAAELSAEDRKVTSRLLTSPRRGPSRAETHPRGPDN